MGQQIRILIIDDHALFRESLGRLLEAEPDFHVAGASASATRALPMIEREEIDLVLLDYDLGEEQGTLRVLERGCCGIFLKHSPPGQLIDAIHRVMSGETWVDSRAVKALVAGAVGRADPQRGFLPLNERERGVLKALFEGLSNKEIAVELRVSENAVKWVLQQLFEKAGVRTRSQLVRIALERQWLDRETAIKR